jgi:hypothetical protein
MYRIVCVEPGYLAKVEEGYLYEVPESYIIRNRKFPGIANLQNCNNLTDVRELLSDVGMEFLIIFGETLEDLYNDLWFRNDSCDWFERNPDIHIYQTNKGFEAMVYLDKETK